MTSLGRLIFFDQPGTGVSDPVTPGALPTLEQWADSITAVLDDLGSSEAVRIASNTAFAPAALFAATHPSRTAALVVLGGYADAGGTPLVRDEVQAASVRMWGTGESQHVVNPAMPWNEEIRATWARMERLAASPGTRALLMPLMTEVDVRAVHPINPRANPRPPPHRRHDHLAGEGEVHRRAHSGRGIISAAGTQLVSLR